MVLLIVELGCWRIVCIESSLSDVEDDVRLLVWSWVRLNVWVNVGIFDDGDRFRFRAIVDLDV